MKKSLNVISDIPFVAIGSVILGIIIVVTVVALIVGGTAGTPAQHTNSGIVGHVLIESSCGGGPAPRPGTPTSVCPPPSPYHATIKVLGMDASQSVAPITSDSSGNFAIPLDPGTYILDPQPIGAIVSSRQIVVVTIGARSAITIIYTPPPIP